MFLNSGVLILMTVSVSNSQFFTHSSHLLCNSESCWIPDVTFLVQKISSLTLLEPCTSINIYFTVQILLPRLPSAISSCYIKASRISYIRLIVSTSPCILNKEALFCILLDLFTCVTREAHSLTVTIETISKMKMIHESLILECVSGNL